MCLFVCFCVWWWFPSYHIYQFDVLEFYSSHFDWCEARLTRNHTYYLSTYTCYPHTHYITFKHHCLYIYSNTEFYFYSKSFLFLGVQYFVDRFLAKNKTIDRQIYHHVSYFTCFPTFFTSYHTSFELLPVQEYWLFFLILW